MEKILIRHGLSEANNRDNIGTPLFGHSQAGLMELGRTQAQNVGHDLRSLYSIDTDTARAATSTMLRTQETAHCAGFEPDRLQSYTVLDEISNRVSRDQIVQALRDKLPPTEAIEQVQELLTDPPEEDIWFTHGFVIATICHVRGLEYPDFIPKHGTIRRVDIG